MYNAAHQTALHLHHLSLYLSILSSTPSALLQPSMCFYQLVAFLLGFGLSIRQSYQLYQLLAKQSRHATETFYDRALWRS